MPEAAPLELAHLLRLMVERDASDLYVKVGTPPMLRVAGQVLPTDGAVLDPQMTQALAESFLTARQRAALRRNQELNLSISLPGVGRFRLNIYLQRGSIALVARRVKDRIPSFEELRLPRVLETLAMAPRGLVLVAGPAGSGKSTTLAALVDYRNTHARGHIVTIEDPIEYLHQDKQSIVSQREVGTDTESFTTALREALRQTPDVILIGEMRDVDSATAAVHFAETGHLVFSSLHAMNATSALERVLHFFPVEAHQEVLFQLSLNLLGVIAQRLVPRLDGSGLVAAVEVLLSTPRVRELIRRGELGALRAAMEAGTQEGMQTFDQALYDLYRRGLVSYETAMEAAESPNDLRLRIKGLKSS